MGSVISDVKCPECGYEHAFCDFYYKTGEEYVSCEICGYYYSCESKIDKELTKRLYEKGKRYYEKGEIDKAMRILKISYVTYKPDGSTLRSEDDTIENKRLHIEEKLKRIVEYDFQYYIKLRNDKPVYNIKEKKGKGSYRYGSSVLSCGGYKNKKQLNELIMFFEINKDKLDTMEYTYKKKGKWYRVNYKLNKEEEVNMEE